MLDFFPVPPADLSAIIALVHHVDHATQLYLAAAVVARFRHNHLWIVYLGMAVDALLGRHH